jgi:3-oxoacyl-[acyl-carrier protein] reductase
MRLSGKVAIVTGAGSGFGKGIAETFAREGAKVAVVDVVEKAAKEVAAAIGANAMAVTCDVSKRADIDAAVRATLKAFGRIDVLVNNAGVAHLRKGMAEIDAADFDRVFDVNVKGLFLFSQAAVEVFRRQGGGGAIVNIGSTAAIRPRPGLSVYNASKGAVHLLSKTLALELAPEKIRICVIAPVAGDTPLLPTFMGADTAELREQFRQTVPLGRLSTPADIASVALFLASDEAEFLTGNVVEVDGGRCV